jgi:predicted secreted protein
MTPSQRVACGVPGSLGASALVQVPRTVPALRFLPQARVVVAAFGLALGLVAAAPAARAQAAAEPANQMSFNVTATAEAPTDWLTLVFSTTREGTDAATVQRELKRALDEALVVARKAAKPGELEVHTGNFSLSPRYGQKGGIVGWQGSTQLIVEGRDAAAIAQLSGRISTLGIASVTQGLSRESQERLSRETTAAAIRLFRERAQAQAELFGFKSYVIREVQVGSEGGARPVPVMALRARAASVAVDEALPVEAGKAGVSATVSGTVRMLP